MLPLGAHRVPRSLILKSVCASGTGREVRRFAEAGATVGILGGVAATVFELLGQEFASQRLAWLALATAVTLCQQGLVFGLGLALLGWWGWRSTSRVRDSRESGALFGRGQWLRWAGMGLAVGGVALALGHPLQRYHGPYDGVASVLGALIASVGFATFAVLRGLAGHDPLLFLGSRLTLALVVILSAAQWLRPRPEAGRPNVVLITVDTLRADHLGLYGSPVPTSPQLDRLAEHADVFLNAFSHAPVTASAVASIMTGQPPRSTATFNNDAMPRRASTLAERFWNAGFRTAAIVSNYVLLRRRGFAEGFDSYDHELTPTEATLSLLERNADVTTAAALDWLRAHRNEAFFLWLHYQDPHGPYLPPPAYRHLFPPKDVGGPLPVRHDGGGIGFIPAYQALGERRDPGYYISQYDGEIRYLDDALAALFQGLEDMGLRRRSLIVLTADHGEGLGEHGYYFAHGHNLFPAVLRVPLILWLPTASAGRRHDAYVQHADIAPTVLAFAGVATPSDLPGRNLLSAEPRDAVILSEAAPPGARYMFSATTRDLQLVLDSRNGSLSAYDPMTSARITDPEELRRLRASALRARLREWGWSVMVDLPSIPRWSRPTGSEMERLRALGYVH